MKIARIATASISQPAFAVGDQESGWVPVTDLGISASTTAGVIGAADQLAASLSSYSGERIEVPADQLHAPVAAPQKILCIGMNYLDHIRESNMQAPERPVLFAKWPNTLVGAVGDIVLDPELTGECDYEVELAVVIGRRTRRVAEEDALSSVFAYTVANDVSARDWQFADPQWDRSKNFDTFLPLGPWLTTADEVADPQDLALGCTVNGEVRQDSSTAEMLFGIAEIIAFLSRGMTLEPGDVILTGTPFGVGMGMDPKGYLAHGDLVRCEVAGLGVLENRVVAP